MHGGLSPDLSSMEQIRRVMRPTDVPDTGTPSSLQDNNTNISGLLCDLLWSDPDKDITGWSENDRGVSFTFGPDVVSRFLQKHDMDLICRAHQVVEDGYEFFSKRQLVTLFSAPNYCGEFDNAGAMMSVDESLLCSFQVFPSPLPPLSPSMLHSAFIRTRLIKDPETGREETEICLRRHGSRKTRHTTTESQKRSQGRLQSITALLSRIDTSKKKTYKCVSGSNRGEPCIIIIAIIIIVRREVFVLVFVVVAVAAWCCMGMHGVCAVSWILKN